MYPGQNCGEIGLSSECVLSGQFEKFKDGLVVKNGVVTELYKFALQSKLPVARVSLWLTYLQPSLKDVKTTTLQTKVNRTLETLKKFAEKKKVAQCKTLSEFLEASFIPPVRNSTQSTDERANSERSITENLQVNSPNVAPETETPNLKANPSPENLQVDCLDDEGLKCVLM